MHELGDGNQCACVSPAINDPDNDGECCHPDPDDNTICFIGKFNITFTKGICKKLPLIICYLLDIDLT